MILFDLDKINRTRDDGFPFNIPIDSPIKMLGVIDERIEEMVLQDVFKIKRVIFNNPATIVFWEDGTKTVVKCNGEKFDQEKGLAMAISKRALAVGNRYHKTFKKWCKEEDDFSEQIKNDQRFKNIKVKADFSVEKISEDNPLKVGEKVVVVATGLVGGFQINSLGEW